MTTTHESDFSKNKDYDHNIALIYDYVEKSIDIVRNNISAVTNKLGLLAGIEITLMRLFLADLPSPSFSDLISKDIDILPCYSCFTFKILAYILSITSITICLWEGYITQGTKLIIEPHLLLREARKGTITQYKEAMINDIWKHTLEKAFQLLEKRSKALKNAIILLAISMTFGVLNIIIHFIFYT